MRSASFGTAPVPSTKTATGMGPIGYLINGKHSIFFMVCVEL